MPSSSVLSPYGLACYLRGQAAYWLAPRRQSPGRALDEFAGLSRPRTLDQDFRQNYVGVSDTGQTDLCDSAYRFPRVLGDA
jgi:hypothetical protein